MTVLFGRSWELQVDTLLLKGEYGKPSLTISFEVERTLKRAPNNASVTIYNLSAEHRKRLQDLGDAVFVRLSVGYRGDNFQIFKGDLRDVRSTRQGPDWVTTITSGDGERAIQRRRTRRSFAPGAALEQVLKDVAGDLQVGLGNLVKGVSGAALEGTGSTRFHSGTTVSGNSARELDRLLRSAGYEWSVQDGEIQVLPRGQALKGQAVAIAPRTGLIGSPEPGTKGATVCTVLLQAGLVPGARVQLESAYTSGLFRVERVTNKGETSGQVWYADLELKQPKK